MLILQDMEDGLIRIGSGRSRGLGSVRGSLSHADIQYIQAIITDKDENEIWGLGRFLKGDNRYGTLSDDVITLTEAPAPTTKGIRSVQRFGSESLNELIEKTTGHFVQRIQGWANE